MSAFLDQHPGGAEVMMEVAGEKFGNGMWTTARGYQQILQLKNLLSQQQHAAAVRSESSLSHACFVADIINRLTHSAALHVFCACMHDP